MKIKYIILTTLLAAFILPVGYVTADLYFTFTESDTEVDGANSFTGLNGASGVVTFSNSTVNKDFAVVVGVIDQQITIVDITTPSNLVAVDSYGDDSRAVDGAIIEPRNIAIFKNHSNAEDHINPVLCHGGGCEYVALVTNQDTLSAYNLTDPEDQIYFLSNYTSFAGGAKINNVLFGDGAGNKQIAGTGFWDVATWVNVTTGDTYAAVSNYDTDSVTFFNLQNPSEITATSNITKGADGRSAAAINIDSPDIELDGAAGLDTFYVHNDGTGIAETPYLIVTAALDDGFQILNLSDPDHTPGDGAKMGYGTVAAGGVVVAGTHTNATDGADGFEVLNGAIDVAVWNTTKNNHYGIIIAQVDSAFTIIDLTDPTQPAFQKQLFNTTFSNGNWWNVTTPSTVEVFTIENRPYAVIGTNGTSSSVSIIDLYEPANPQPVTGIIYDDMPSDNPSDFDNLAGIEGLSYIQIGSDHYLATTSYEDDGLTLIKMTGDRPSSGGASKICGFNYDCAAPSISINDDTGISINNKSMSTDSRYNNVDVTEAKVGQLVTIKATIYEEFEISKVNLYFDMQGDPSWNNADAAIRYYVSGDSTETIDNNGIFNADVVATELGDNLTEVKFKIMFTGEMESSHIALQSIDDSTNYQMLYFKDALEVTGTPTQTSTDAVDGEVTQTTATVPGWVKNTAGWWADGAISEGEFVKGIEFLIQQQIIDTDAQTASSDGTGAAIPDWVKNTAGWWADGAISEGEFVNAIEHLVKTGTIIII